MPYKQRPDDEQLALYFDGRLSYEEEAAFSERVAQDPALERELEELEWALNGLEDDLEGVEIPEEALTRAAVALWPEEPARGSVSERVGSAIKIIARWVEDQLEAISPAPVLASGLVRGEAREELHYQLTVGEIPLEVDLEVDGPERFALFIRPIQAPPPGTLLHLSRSGEVKAISSLTHEGISLPALPLGAYELRLERAAERLGVLEIDLLARAG